ncbi:2Fe-2S iron-sulfur cluster-binding protein, partial [Intestinibacillus massiliensis]|uniref:2Fe-2S iron-sulfur cluster-binding protein n=1 Tax=Intestinibacillus massiliensis TaxID=1871029 RepID=UPI001356342B
MPILTILRGTGRIQREVPQGRLLSDALRDMQAAPAMPCGGNHTCGKCKVRAEGALSPMGEAERAHLTPQEAADGVRLACFAAAEGDCTVYAAQDAVETLSWARMPAFQADGEGYGLAADIGTTTVAVRLYDRAR